MKSLLTLTILFVVTSLYAADSVPGLKVPAGFKVTQYAGSDLANDIYCLHVDAEGRVVVAGKGYVRQLVDTTGKGVADKAVSLIPDPQGGPMGLLWEKDVLYVVADGGLKKYSNVDGKQIPKEKPETILALKSSGEHEGHAVKRGPDGWLYWLGGNNTGVTEKTIKGEGSPVTKPMAGCLLKISPDGKQVHVVAHGFRNPYDFDFDYSSSIFTFDSDNERCVGLPWYEPCRFYQIVPGGHYGWLNPQVTQTWRRPHYFPDIIPPVCTAGRGSPTGVACYRHTAYPQKYQKGVFYADWTFGKIWFTRPGEKQPKAEAFLESTGDNGFAPTGLAMCPISGDLFISVGGRGTRGSVYRVSYDNKPKDAKLIPIVSRKSGTDLSMVLTGKIHPDDLKKYPDNSLFVIREWQLAWGDICSKASVGGVYEGYTLQSPPNRDDSEQYRKALLEAFPSGESKVDREISRTLAMLEDDDPASVVKMTYKLTKLTDPIEKIHYLIVLSRLSGKRAETDTRTVVDFLLTLDAAFEKLQYTRDRFWPIRMTETLVSLFQHDKQLASAIVADPRFGDDAHLWLAKVPGISQLASAKAFAAHSGTKKNYEWTGGHVEFIGKLPAEERRKMLLTLWERGGLEDAILLQLVKQPVVEDRAKFLKGLSSSQGSVVAGCASALIIFDKSDDELVPAIKALRRYGDPKVDSNVREKIFDLLEQRTGAKAKDTAGWEEWLTKTHPELAKNLQSPGFDAEKWKKRLAEVAWDNGDAENGKKMFLKSNCAACHNAGNAAGPSLQGAAKRFSRDDLFVAILDPNRDVSPRFRTTRITTVEDKVYEGIIIYEAVDGVILQTGADTTVRVAGSAIASKKPGTLSLMPTGLIDAFTAKEIADLYAYLKAFDGPPK